MAPAMASLLTAAGVMLSKRQTGLDTNFIVQSFDSITKLNIAITITTLASVAVRMFVRLKMLRQFGKEDWAMVATIILYCVQSSMVFLISAVGKRYVTGHLTLMNEFNQINRAGNSFFSLTMVALKFSLGFFFLRIVGHKKPQRYTIYALLALTSLVGATYFGFSGFTCAQVKDVGALTGPHCTVQHAATIVFATFSVTNIISDFAMTLIALVALWKAQLPRLTKTIASSLLALGCVGAVASMVRLAIVLQPVDLTGYIRQLFRSGLWLDIEISVGIIAANLAMTRPLLQAALQKMRLVSSHRTESKTATAPSKLRSSRFGTRPSTAGRRLDADDPVLLDEIRKETTVTIVDEEKEDVGTMYWSRPVNPRQL